MHINWLWTYGNKLREVVALMMEHKKKSWRRYGAYKFLIRLSILVGGLCKDILPCLSNLKKRGVLVDDRCEQCDEEVKSSGHLCLNHNFAAKVWGVIFYLSNSTHNAILVLHGLTLVPLGQPTMQWWYSFPCYCNCLGYVDSEEWERKWQESFIRSYANLMGGAIYCWISVCHLKGSSC